MMVYLYLSQCIHVNEVLLVGRFNRGEVLVLLYSLGKSSSNETSINVLVRKYDSFFNTKYRVCTESLSIETSTYLFLRCFGSP